MSVMSPMRWNITSRTNYKWWAFMAIALGSFTSALDQLSVTVALPTIAGHFGTDLPTVQWIVVGHALTVSVMLLPMGGLSDIIGRKRVYVAGFILFILGAALAGSAATIATLIAARIIQGCGAAMAQSTGRAMILPIFSISERGKILGAQMSVVGSGAIAGPALGGLLVSTLGWRWVFLINLPLGILALAAVLILLNEPPLVPRGERPKFDWLGAVLSMGTLVVFLMAIANGLRFGWTSPAIVAGAAAFILLLGLFIWWELRAPAPMLDLRLFKLPQFSLGVSTGYISFLGSFPVFFLMPFFLQQVQGYSPGQIGLIMVPNFLGMIILGPVGGVLSDRYGWRKFRVGGLALSAAGMFLLTRITETSPLSLAMGGMILQGCGMGIFSSPNTNSIISAVDQTRYGVVSALLSLIRNSASVLGTALATAIVTVTMAAMGHTPSLEAVADAPHAFITGLHRVFIVLGCLFVVGMVLAMFKGGRSEAAPAPAQGSPLGRSSSD